MKDVNTKDREMFSPLQEAQFAPGSDDREFLGAVRHRVTVRRRNRRIGYSAVSSTAVVLLLVGILNMNSVFGPGFEPLLDENNMASIGWSNDELASITTFYEDVISLNADGDELSEQMTSDLALLFEDESLYDPVDYLGMYDEAVQEQVLEQLKDFSIFDASVDNPSSGRGKI